jgi:ferredoxin-NADP reductase
VSHSLTLRVSGVRRASVTTRVVSLALAGSRFPYRAGQSVRIGPADRAERVPYSIASWPEETRRRHALELLIKMEPSGQWGDRFPALRRGNRLEVLGPFGTFVFPPHPAEREFLFIAGGTGIAPLRSMIRHALDIGQPGRYRVLYSARSPSDFAYLPELRRLTRGGRVQLSLTVTRAIPARWRGGQGRISPALLAPLISTPDTLCFVCGPAAMVDDVPRQLRELGIARERIRIEEW